MRLAATFISIVAIWSTTPLAIAWSAADIGFLSAITWRLVPAAALSWLLCRALGIEVRWHRRAIASYCAAGLGMSVAMPMAYWATQHVESGMLAVIFGLTPILSGLLSIWLLEERMIGPGRLLALAAAIAGFALIFRDEMGVSKDGALALAALFLAVWIFSFSAVLVKRIDLGGHALAQSCGALLVCTPLLLTITLLSGGGMPADPSWRGIASIVYLVVFGSIFGFVGYFYVLQRMSPRDVGLINLISPVFALWLGAAVNDERLTASQWVGAAIVLISIALYLWGGSMARD